MLVWNRPALLFISLRLAAGARGHGPEMFQTFNQQHNPLQKFGKIAKTYGALRQGLRWAPMGPDGPRWARWASRLQRLLLMTMMMMTMMMMTMNLKYEECENSFYIFAYQPKVILKITFLTVLSAAILQLRNFLLCLPIAF